MHLFNPFRIFRTQMTQTPRSAKAGAFTEQRARQKKSNNQPENSPKVGLTRIYIPRTFAENYSLKM
jgi:hypothetical protein